MKYFSLLLPLLILISCQDNTSSTTELSVLPASDPTENDFIKIFKADGATQCQTTAVAVDVMASDLFNSGIDVVCSQKAHDGELHKKSCGAVTGAINVYQINKSNLEGIVSLGFQPVSTLINNTIETCQTTKPPQLVQYQKVYKRDIVAQCQGSVATPESMAKELMALDIDVSCAQKSSDGLIYAAVCGGLSDGINVFRIDKKDVLKAQVSGFRPVTELPNYVDTVCKPKFEKVYKPYSYVQCGGPELDISGKKIPSSDLNVVAQELITSDIAVKCSQRNTDGNSPSVFVAVCGATVKGINVFEISKYNVKNAALLGFSPVSNLPNYTDIVCQ